MTPETDTFDLNGLEVCLPELLAEVYKRFYSKCETKGMLVGPVVLECDIVTALAFDKAARLLESQNKRILQRMKWSPERLYRFFEPPLDILVLIGSERTMKFDCGLTLNNYQAVFSLMEC